MLGIGRGDRRWDHTMQALVRTNLSVPSMHQMFPIRTYDFDLHRCLLNKKGIEGAETVRNVRAFRKLLLTSFTPKQTCGQGV